MTPGIRSFRSMIGMALCMFAAGLLLVAVLAPHIVPALVAVPLGLLGYRIGDFQDSPSYY